MNEKQISLLAAFLAAKVEYAVVGGVAVNAHGYVRATNDLDNAPCQTVSSARANRLYSIAVNPLRYLLLMKTTPRTLPSQSQTHFEPRTSHLEPASGFTHSLSFRSEAEESASPSTASGFTRNLSFRSEAEESASPSTDSGFTLIELLIVMSIMLIIMAFAVPQMLKVKKTADEDSAIQTMRTIGSAEASYNSAYPGSGYGCPLTTLGGDPKSGAPSAQASQLIDPALATSGQKSGYTFTVTCGNKVTVSNQDVYTSYSVTGVPQTVGKTGDRGYCSDENNIIKFDPAGGTNCTQTIQ